MSEVFKINISVLKNYNTKLQNEKSNFNTSTFNRFKSSYFFSCSDSTIVAMRQKLNNKYNEIQKLYNSICNFYDYYLKDVDNVENALAENGKSAIEAAIKSNINQLPELKNYNYAFQRFNRSTLDVSQFFLTQIGENPKITKQMSTPNNESTRFGKVGETPELNQEFKTTSTTIENMAVEELEDDNESLNSIDPNKKYSEEEITKLIKSYKQGKETELDEYKNLLDATVTELNHLESMRISFSDLSDQYNNLKIEADGKSIEIINNYKIYCSAEKLKELGLTQNEIQNMDTEELLKICKSKDSDIKALYQAAQTAKNDHLDEKVRNMTEFKTYQEYEKYISGLKQDKMLLQSAIMKTKNMIKTAEYNFLPLSEDYQNFDETSIIKTPLETIPNEPSIKKLLEASKANPELIKMYKYIYKKEGKDAATKFIENMEDTLNQIIGSIKAEKFLNSLNENSSNALINHLKTAFKGTGDGVENFFAGLAAWINSKDVYSESEYETMYILQGLQDEKYKGLLNGLLDNNYEISQSIGNMLPSIALSAILTPTVGTVSMGVSAGGNSYHSGLVSGESTGNSILYGVLSGLSEATLEKYLGAIPGLSEVDIKGVKTFAQAMFKEGIEEGTQEYIDALLQSGLLGQNIDLSEVTKNAGKSALYGAITGGIMNTPSLAVNSMKSQNTFKGELSSFTVEQLENIKNKTFFQLQTEDGKVYSYNDVFNYAFNNEYQSLLASSPVKGENVGEIGDNMIFHAENAVNTFINSKLDAQKLLRGLLLTPRQFLGRFINTKVQNNPAITNKILNEGIYHFTDIESAQKIMDSKYIKASGKIASYGKKKSFFFAGLPTYEQVAMNVVPSSTAVAIKINVDESSLPNLYCREFCDNTITNYGDFHFNEGDANLVYLVLKPDGNKDIKYVEVSKEEYEHYQVNLPKNTFSSFLKNVKYNLIGLSTSYDILMNDIQNIKGKISGLSESEVAAKLNEIINPNIGIIDPNINWLINKFKKNKSNQNTNTENVENKINSINKDVNNDSNVKITEAELQAKIAKYSELKKIVSSPEFIAYMDCINNPKKGFTPSYRADFHQAASEFAILEKELSNLNVLDSINKNINENIKTERLNTLKKEINNFNLEKFFTGQSENDGGILLITPEQSIMTECFGKNKQHGFTVEDIYKVIYNNEQIEFKGDWTDTVKNDGNICIQLCQGLPSIVWMPDNINSFQYKALENFSKEISSIAEKNNLNIDFISETNANGLNAILNEAKKKIGNTNKNNEIIVGNTKIVLEENSTMQNKINNNLINLKSEILSLIDLNMAPEIKARKLYIELNKRMNYDIEYYNKNKETDIIDKNKNTSFENLNSNKIICFGWAELYRELLLVCGFHPNQVTIKGKNHAWVEIDLENGNIIIADSTDAINHSNDLVNCKLGMPTNGFLGAPKSWSGARINKIDGKYLAEYGRKWLNVDQKLGYVSGNDYFDIKVQKANDLFANSNAYNNLFNEKNLNDSINQILNTKLPENIDGYAAYIYYNKLKNILISDEYKSEVKVNLDPIKINGQVESCATVWIGEKPIIAFSESLGKRNISNKQEYEKLIKKAF